MPCHAIILVSGVDQRTDPPTVPTPEPPSLPDVVPGRIQENVLANFNEVLDGQNYPATHLRADGSLGQPEHLRALHRFDASEGKTALLDAFEDGVAADIEWYELRYHECDHDRPPGDRTGCGGWNVERSYGTIPDGT